MSELIILCLLSLSFFFYIANTNFFGILLPLFGLLFFNASKNTRNDDFINKIKVKLSNPEIKIFQNYGIYHEFHPEEILKSIKKIKIDCLDDNITISKKFSDKINEFELHLIKYYDINNEDEIEDEIKKPSSYLKRMI